MIYKILALLTLSFSLFAESVKPNILFITVDDMNWDSVGAYGCKIPEITPHIDSLANEGLLFERAYVQASNCSPSRVVFQSGRYPSSSGMRGFYMVDANYPMLPELLRQNGYFTSVINKPRDTSFNDKYDELWDHSIILKGAEKRGAQTYAKGMSDFFELIKDKNEPFYCVVNIADPHKPFFNDPKSKESGLDEFGPSRVYKISEITVPDFLPKHPGVRIEMRNYYNSVKRADDCIGAILKSLKESSYEDNTLVIFVSDHGMPLPFAKSSLYGNGIRTPWIMKWPNKLKPQSKDTQHMISAVDFMPTILDVCGINKPKGLEGRSFFSVLKGEEQKYRDYVFAEFNENAIGLVFPTRAVHNKKFCYVFNPWADGKRTFSSASSSHKSYKVIKELSKTDQEVAKRFNHLVYRDIEELYDLEKDPHCLNNLVKNPEYLAQLKQMRAKLTQHMTKINDYALEAMKNRESPKKLAQFMQQQDKESIQRAEVIQWKRHKNRVGGTGKNTELFASPANL
ncbi:sulfatase [Lentisphaera marina]|uniref:sulfatase family protein n=1 Tax=Lentisphaera marina TaxID=1111041 RepID=UPI002366146F|nr:sulfatase [Lentisphaera marina]MDD7984633.1 sulfatase [Lentisphaera marina]